MKISSDSRAVLNRSIIFCSIKRFSSSYLEIKCEIIINFISTIVIDNNINRRSQKRILILGASKKYIMSFSTYGMCKIKKIVLATGGFPKHFWFQFRHLYLQNAQENEL